MGNPVPGIVKLERAEAQLELLYKELAAAIDPAHHPVRVEIDAEPYPKPSDIHDPREWLAFTLRVAEAPTFDEQIGLHIGETLHNFRSALDHLAWGLVRRRGIKRLTSKQAQHVEFPLAGSNRGFRKPRYDPLPGVPFRPYRAIIESYQPYKQTSTGYAMRRLRELNNRDKHRILLPVAALPQSADINLHYEGAVLIGQVNHIRFGRAVKPGTPLITLVLAGGTPGQRKVSMEGSIWTQPFFPHSLMRPQRGVDAVVVEETLNSIRDTCRQAIEEIGAHL